LKRSQSEYLPANENQDLILDLLGKRPFLAVVMAPVCRSFSRAVTSPVRSSRFPRGLPNLTMTMREKVSEGNQMAEFLEKVIKECERLLLAYWAENHDGSFLWALKGWKRFKESDSPHVFRCSFCRFGNCWRKNTRFANNTAL